jgi:hypothetical protein
MDKNLIKILDEFNELKGQFVITDRWKIERLVAIAEDDMDYYYVTYDGRDLNWQTCVGRIMPLKGYIRQKDYDYFIHIAKLNHYDQYDLNTNGNIDIFLESLREYISKKYDEKNKQYSNNEFITEFCWDLN